jgi:hypothetical protein
MTHVIGPEDLSRTYEGADPTTAPTGSSLIERLRFAASTSLPRSLTGICIKSLTQDEMTHRTLSSVARCIHNHEDELSNKQHRPGDTSPGLPLDRGFLSGTAISRGGPSHFSWYR